jgi:type II secretory pathway pseudopilin PulG
LGRRAVAGFTMLEIAICLAIIAFALVAIIGVLPFGMGVQRDNRQETIINQEASVFLDAIRNGQSGLDDLTNYITRIEVKRTRFQVTTNNKVLLTNVIFGPLSSTYVNDFANSRFELTNGFWIVGLLSAPRIYRTNEVGYFDSNYVVAYCRSMSGPAVEKVPQSNPDVMDQALTYRLIPEIMPYWEFDTTWTNKGLDAGGQFRAFSRNLYGNLYNVRLSFRWPYSQARTNGASVQVFRTLSSGSVKAVQMLPDTSDASRPSNLFFFQPRTFQKAS